MEAIQADWISENIEKHRITYRRKQMISIYSLIWTFINCGLMTLAILFLRTRKNFLARYGTFSLVVLFFCCIIRMFIPVEFPNHQYILHNTFLYNHLLKPFLTVTLPEWTLYFALIIWFIGSVIVFLRLFRQTLIAEREINTNCQPADRVAVELLKELDPSGKVDVKVSPNIIVAVLTGFFHPVIYLPAIDYSRQELRYILLHEYTHYKRKDIWTKLFFNILYVIFWWNPFIYVLKLEASGLIEFHCDKQLTKDLSEREVLNYLQILRDNVERMQDSTNSNSLTTIGFIEKANNGPTIQRFRLLLNRTAKSRTGIIPKVVVLVIAAVWMICSYYFILQTYYSAPSQDITEKNIETVATEDNAYLEELEDGSYIFHFKKFSSPVSKEEVESGMYDFYPIIHLTVNENWIEKLIHKIQQFNSFY